MYPPLTFQHSDITYNRDNDTYEVMPTESERKGALIQEINTIQLSLNKGAIDPEQFEMLMQLDIDRLKGIVNDQASALQRAKLRL